MARLWRLELDALACLARQSGGVLERDRDPHADPAVELQDPESLPRQPHPERHLAARRDGERLAGKGDPLLPPALAPDADLLDALEDCPARQRRGGVEAEAEAALA